MMSIPKKVVLMLALAVSVGAGAWFVSGRQRQSFSNDVVSPAASVMSENKSSAENAASTTETAALSASSDVGQSEADTKIANTDTGNEGMKGERGVKGGEQGDAGTVNLSIVDRLVSFGFEDRSSREIDTVIVHSSYDALGNDPYSVSGIIEEYRQYGVSAHYLIDRKGVIYRLVEDRDVAYHAGVSKTPDGRTGVNEFSIGIEVIEKDTDSPTSAQYAGLRSLIASLKSKYSIKYVLGHSDIAPGRKTDPWGFDWKELK